MHMKMQMQMQIAEITTTMHIECQKSVEMPYVCHFYFDVKVLTQMMFKTVMQLKELRKDSPLACNLNAILNPILTICTTQ